MIDNVAPISSVLPPSSSSLVVHCIPAFDDNYIWLFHRADGTHAYVVDPGTAKPVLDFLALHPQLVLSGIIITHHHPDHVGGINDLLSQTSSAPSSPTPVVYGPGHLNQVTQPVEENSQLHLADKIQLEVLTVPGHTLDHLAYFEPTSPLLFCGDTLFASGCGRLFEGTAEQMWHSLRKIKQLPKETVLYCAHEYTAANLAFAHAVEPGNEQLQKWRQQVDRLRQTGKATVPTTLSQELATNPFLRDTEPEVQQKAAEYARAQEMLTGHEVFAALRRWKDNF